MLVAGDKIPLAARQFAGLASHLGGIALDFPAPGAQLAGARAKAGITVQARARRGRGPQRGSPVAGVELQAPGAARTSSALVFRRRVDRLCLKRFRVFGSVARREETPESDVDLLVDFPAGERGLFPLLKLARKVEELVGRPVDVAAAEVMAGPVRERALAEAVPL